MSSPEFNLYFESIDSNELVGVVKQWYNLPNMIELSTEQITRVARYFTKSRLPAEVQRYLDEHVKTVNEMTDNNRHFAAFNYVSEQLDTVDTQFQGTIAKAVKVVLLTGRGIVLQRVAEQGPLSSLPEGNTTRSMCYFMAASDLMKADLEIGHVRLRPHRTIVQYLAMAGMGNLAELTTQKVYPDGQLDTVPSQSSERIQNLEADIVRSLFRI